MRRESISIALVLVLAACGSEPPRAPAITQPREREAEAPADPEVAPRVDDDAFTPAGAPQLVTSDAAFWADLERGVVARAARDPGTGAIGRARIIARDRRSPAHLARESDGDLYWVDYLREEARCDFVRLPAAPGATPEVLFSESLGDFSEMGCETDLAVDDTRLYWLHGHDIRAASHASASPVIETLATAQRYPRELAVDATRVYWTYLGADPYEEDLTRRGGLRALPLSGARVVTIATRLTEPSELTLSGSQITLLEQTDEGPQLRSYPAPD